MTKLQTMLMLVKSDLVLNMFEVAFSATFIFIYNQPNSYMSFT